MLTPNNLISEMTHESSLCTVELNYLVLGILAERDLANKEKLKNVAGSLIVIV